MAIITVISTPTHRSLMHRSKADLRLLIDQLSNGLGIESSGLQNALKHELARAVLDLMRRLPDERTGP